MNSVLSAGLEKTDRSMPYSVLLDAEGMCEEKLEIGWLT